MALHRSEFDAARRNAVCQISNHKFDLRTHPEQKPCLNA